MTIESDASLLGWEHHARARGLEVLGHTYVTRGPDANKLSRTLVSNLCSPDFAKRNLVLPYC